MDRNGDLRQKRVRQQPPGLQQLLPPRPYALGVRFGAWQAGTPANPLGCWAVGWAALVLTAARLDTGSLSTAGPGAAASLLWSCASKRFCWWLGFVQAGGTPRDSGIREIGRAHV